MMNLLWTSARRWMIERAVGDCDDTGWPPPATVLSAQESPIHEGQIDFSPWSTRMATFRILSLDGGGIRGLLTTLILERICQQPGLTRAFDSLDLVAGNSSGGLIAIGMAHGLGQPAMVRTLAGIESAFQQGRALFGDPIPWWKGGWWLTSKYESAGRVGALQGLLGHKTQLGDLARKVMVTSFDLDNEGVTSGVPGKPRTWKPKIFHNLDPIDTDATDRGDGDVFAWQAASYCTAAITYFPTIDGFVDGGLYANNPSMSALAQVFDRRYAPREKPKFDDVLMLSIGAGQNLAFLEGKELRWGGLQWFLRGQPVSLVTDGMVGIADYECAQILGKKNYYRVAPPFPPGEHVAIDAVDRIDYMNAFVDHPNVKDMIKECAAWMREHWMPGIPQPTPLIQEQTSKHVNTATELTCLMPIKSGFLETLDTRTFATRLHMVFKVLQGLRVASREVRSRRPILDIVDAARTVHSFSWSIIAERQLLLSVTFDRPWEPYIRVIWQNLGKLMDLILCSCEGFVPSSEGHDAFVAFVRQHQVETGFFYPASRFSVEDQRYLAHLERKQRDGEVDFDRKVVGIGAPGPEHEAESDRHPGDDVETREQWLAALEALFALRAVFPPGTPDEVVLHDAVHSLLDKPKPPTGLPDTPAVRWFETPLAGDATSAISGDAPLPDTSVGTTGRRPLILTEVQGGISEPYQRVSHGFMLLARIDDPVKARRFVAQIKCRITPGGNPFANDPTNIAFTASGLRQLEVKESEVLRFPKEFREGMEARAGLLGDVRENNPEAWTLPELNVRYSGVTAGGVKADVACDLYPGEVGAPAPSESPARVRMSTVDIVLLLHVSVAWHGESDERSAERKELRQRIRPRVEKLCEDAWNSGVRVLSVQPMRRMTKPRPAPAATAGSSNGAPASHQPEATTNGKEQQTPKMVPHDHFGFFDGLSQPRPTVNPQTRDEIAAGEVFVGFANDRGDPDWSPRYATKEEWDQGPLIDSGSFLVVRKLRQDVKTLRDVVTAAEEKSKVPAEELLGQMVGRRRDGTPLTKPSHPLTGDPAKDNDFTFEGDDNGETCPFHAHIRRANPRFESAQTNRENVPRIVRAGLSYGPDVNESNLDQDRGLIFMAYNADIAEQFEVIQRWMTGGNPPSTDQSTRVFSGQPDPLLGLAEQRHHRMFRFFDGAIDIVQRFELGLKPFVTLQWGLYLFVPSMAALEKLAKDPEPDVDMQQSVVQLGASVIEQLVTADQWAAVLEDSTVNLSGTTRAVLAAITAMHRGVLRTPYGVLVTQRDIAMNVLRGDPGFSVSEYQRRFAASVGESYLGMDRGADYYARSAAPNRILMAFPEDEARYLARRAMRAVLARRLRLRVPQGKLITLAFDNAVGCVLGCLARRWFDVPDGTHFHLGFPKNDGDKNVYCPFHFLAPSRYVFSSPNPRDIVAELGRTHGKMVFDKAVELGQDRSATFNGPISSELKRTIDDPVQFVTELVGLVFGFIAPVLGNACLLLFAWANDESLWRVQQRYLNAKRESEEAAMAVLTKDIESGMCAHPAPALLHRTVTEPAHLGNVAVDTGDRVVICVGAVASADIRGVSDPKAVFAGDRSKPNHPTHSCPASSIAMGTLVGVFSALFDLEHELVPSQMPFSIRVRV